MKHHPCITLTAFSLLLWGAAQAAEPIGYPEGYRHWTHVKSMTIHAGHPLQNPFLGIHHVYANDLALQGMQDNRYADGAAFVFDQLQSKEQDKASIEGERVLIGVMLKDSGRFADTAGWGYEAWSGNSRSQRLVNDGGASCHACHTQRKQQDYVFSEWRD